MVYFTGRSKYGYEDKSSYPTKNKVLVKTSSYMIPYTFFVLYFWLGFKMYKTLLDVNR